MTTVAHPHHDPNRCPFCGRRTDYFDCVVAGLIAGGIVLTALFG